MSAGTKEPSEDGRLPSHPLLVIPCHGVRERAGRRLRRGRLRRVGEKGTEKAISIDVGESNKSATEDPSVGGSGEKEPENSEVSAARRGFGGGFGGETVVGIACGDATGKGGAWTRRLDLGEIWDRILLI